MGVGGDRMHGPLVAKEITFVSMTSRCDINRQEGEESIAIATVFVYVIKLKLMKLHVSAHP
jgi:hypothetical protein